MRCFPCLLLAAGLAPFGSAKTTCSKIDIDSRRSADQGIGITIDARKWVNCDEVDLSITSALDSDNKLLAAGAQELSRYIGVSQRLKRLKLTGNFIGDEGAAYIAAGLSSNSVLESLWLGQNNISDTGLSAIMEALENNQQLRELKLDFNSIHSTDSVYNTIDPAQSISGLQHIDLTGNRLDDDSAFLLLNAAPLENQQVQQLMLGLNQITDVGAAGIADVLATDPPSLTGLWLDGNNISDVGAEALALSLRNNSHIEKLSLTGNEGYFGQWGDAVRVQLSLGTEQRVDGKGDFDCISHVSQVWIADLYRFAVCVLNSGA